jgi:hypothetical protein
LSIKRAAEFLIDPSDGQPTTISLTIDNQEGSILVTEKALKRERAVFLRVFNDLDFVSSEVIALSRVIFEIYTA